MSHPRAQYTNSIVLYHWRKCAHSQRFMPIFRDLVHELKSQSDVFPAWDVYEIEVEDHKSRLRELGVVLGAGVPRIVIYNREGVPRVFEGARTPHNIISAAQMHALTVDPAIVQPTPTMVLYFRYGCPACVAFMPVFMQFAVELGGRGTACAVDTELHPHAMRSLADNVGSLTVPHVVFKSHTHQVAFEGDRTVADILSFFIHNTTINERVRFKGGDQTNDSSNSRLVIALNELQQRAMTVLGTAFQRVFEPENAVVTFIGRRLCRNAHNDQMYILITPRETPENKTPAMAAVYGCHMAPFKVKIYLDRQPDALLHDKRLKQFDPVSHTDPHVQSMLAFGYHVELNE